MHSHINSIDPIQVILDERARQDEKWGEQNHNDLYWLGILTEEVGELAKELIGGDESTSRNELVHVGAVALAWLECMNRRRQYTELKKDINSALESINE